LRQVDQARGDLYTVESDLQVVMAQAGAHPNADHFCGGLIMGAYLLFTEK
jgi:hypothetical protein